MVGQGHGRAKRTIFAVGRGQYENIGDIILRRPLLDWVREAGPLHVYTGASPDGYDEGLGLREGDVAHRSLRRFLTTALVEALKGRGTYVFKPGEIQMTIVGMKEHLVVLPLLAVLRVRGGRAVRVGVGSRGFARLPRLLLRPSIALSDLTAWRDVGTASYLGGRAMPDLALSEGADDASLLSARDLRGAAGGGRDVLVVSLRGDGVRPYPSRHAIEGLRQFAEERGLSVVAVSQVTWDDEVSARLARDLGGRHVSWREARGHDEQERSLRELYARTAVVVSDRLHVALAAFTEGAVPVAGLVTWSDKIERHLRTIGVHDVHLDLASDSAAAVVGRLRELELRRPEMFGALLRARADLREVRAEVLDVLTAERRSRASSGATGRDSLTGRPTVHHLGRAGEVAGGMTQVLNGYLGWDFDEVNVTVLETRGAPGDLMTGARRSAAAATSILGMPRRSSVVVAHLSAGGSFVREGALLLLARARGIATVAHLHGSSFAAFAERFPPLVRLVLRAAHRVITLSQEMDDVVERAGAGTRAVRVPNALPPGHPAPKTRTVVFGGAVSRRKGVDVLLEAWSRVEADGWELVIAGPVLEPDLRRDLTGVRWTGALPHAELMDLLDRSRIAVLPSRDEAMPMFVLEAMARDNAVISTRVGGIAGVLDGRGVVLEPGDAESLRRSLQELLEDDGACERLARAARSAFDEDYSAERVFPRAEGVWLDALRAAGEVPGRAG